MSPFALSDASDERDVVDVEQLDALRRRHPELALRRLPGAVPVGRNVSMVTLLKPYSFAKPRHDLALADTGPSYSSGGRTRWYGHELEDVMHRAFARDFVDDRRHLRLREQRAVFAFLRGAGRWMRQRDQREGECRGLHRAGGGGCLRCTRATLNNGAEPPAVVAAGRRPLLRLFPVAAITPAAK